MWSRRVLPPMVVFYQNEFTEQSFCFVPAAVHRPLAEDVVHIDDVIGAYGTSKQERSLTRLMNYIQRESPLPIFVEGALWRVNSSGGGETAMYVSADTGPKGLRLRDHGLGLGIKLCVDVGVVDNLPHAGPVQCLNFEKASGDRRNADGVVEAFKRFYEPSGMYSVPTGVTAIVAAIQARASGSPFEFEYIKRPKNEPAEHSERCIDVTHIYESKGVTYIKGTEPGSEVAKKFIAANIPRVGPSPTLSDAFDDDEIPF